MRGDLVILDADRIRAYRLRSIQSKMQFYEAMGVHGRTGARILQGKSVSLAVASRVAEKMGVKVATLVKGWHDKESS